MKRNIKSLHGFALILGAFALALFGIVQTASAHTDRDAANTSTSENLFQVVVDRVSNINKHMAETQPAQTVQSVQERAVNDTRVQKVDTRQTEIQAQTERKSNVPENSVRERREVNMTPEDHAEVRTNTRQEVTSENRPSTRGIDRARAVSAGEAFENTREKLTNRVEDRRDDVEAKRAELHEKRDEKLREMRDRREEVRERITDRARDRAEALMTRMLERFDAALERLATLADRIESRIEKLEELHDIELTDARDALEAARAEIREASVNLAVIAEETKSALADAESPQAAFLAVRDMLHAAKDSILSARSALVEALREIKVALDLPLEEKAETEDVDETDANDTTEENEDTESESEEE